MSIDREKTLLINQSNPKLTGNIKIVVEDDKNFWFSSFDDVVELDEIRFKKLRPGLNSNYAFDTGRFFRQLVLEKSTIWENSNLEQFKAGPEINKNLLFKKKYKYLAPLWIANQKIPEYFIIFKTQSPFSEQYKSDFVGFMNTTLINSEIMYVYDIKNSSLGSYLEDTYSKVKNKIYGYDDPNNLNNLYLYGIDYRIGDYINKIQIRDNIGENLDDEELINLYEEKELFIPNLINLEFLFDDPEDLREEYNLENYHEYYNLFYYYGIYCDLEELTKFKIDLNKHNEILSNPIKNQYSQLIKSEYILDEFENKSDLYLNSFLSTEFIQQDNILYFLKDKYLNLYNIYNYSNKILSLDSKSFDLETVLGYELNTFEEIPGILLSGQSNSSLLFEIGSIEKFVFNNGDYLAIYSSLIPNMEWRVIASDDNCCYSGEDCYFDSPKFNFKASTFEVFELNGENYNYVEYLDCYHYSGDQTNTTFVLKINVNSILKIEEGDLILMSWEECGNLISQYFNIYGVTYDHELNTTTFYLIDINGKYFQNLQLVLELNFEYHQHSFYYSYFNPKGSINEVGERIKTCFNSFKNKIIQTEYSNNKLIFYNTKYGESFNRFIFKWNFTDSPTESFNFKINGQIIRGIFLYDTDDKLILNSKHGFVEFFKGSKSLTKNRFYVDKDFGLNNIQGNELIVTKINGLSPLKSVNVEGTLVYYRPIIEKLEYLDKYLVYEIKDEYDEIFLSSSNKVTAYYQFYPTINEASIYEIQKLSWQEIVSLEACEYDKLYEFVISEVFLSLPPMIPLAPLGNDINKLKVYLNSNGNYRLLKQNSGEYVISITPENKINAVLLDPIQEYLQVGNKIYICYETYIPPITEEEVVEIKDCDYDATILVKTLKSTDLLLLMPYIISVPNLSKELFEKARYRENMKLYHIDQNNVRTLINETYYYKKGGLRTGTTNEYWIIHIVFINHEYIDSLPDNDVIQLCYKET